MNPAQRRKVAIMLAEKAKQQQGLQKLLTPPQPGMALQPVTPISNLPKPMVPQAPKPPAPPALVRPPHPPMPMGAPKAPTFPTLRRKLRGY